MGRRPNRPATTKPIFIKVLLTGFMDKLLIPCKYIKLHRETLGKKCVLWPTHTQNSWPVKTKRIDNELYFKKGWDEFAKHHSLQFGDLLIFRHVKYSEFDVDVVDKSGTPREPAVTFENDQLIKDSVPVHTSRHRKTNRKTAALTAAEELISSSEFPCFKKMMKHAYVRSNAYLHVPIDYSEEHLKNTRNVKIELLDKTWTVKVLRRPCETRTLLGKGWSDLARENSLQVGDVCVFQLINAKNYTLKLTIFSHTSQKNQRHYKQCQVKLKPTGSKLTLKSKELFGKAYEEAEKFQSTSKYPSVVISMQYAYVDNGYLHVPLAFHKEMCKKEGVNEVKLQYLDEERKMIMMNVRRQCRISKGWGTFVKEKSVEVGDACVLELINKEDNVIKISLFKYCNS